MEMDQLKDDNLKLRSDIQTKEKVSKELLTKVQEQLNSSQEEIKRLREENRKLQNVIPYVEMQNGCENVLPLEESQELERQAMPFPVYVQPTSRSHACVQSGESLDDSFQDLHEYPDADNKNEDINGEDREGDDISSFNPLQTVDLEPTVSLPVSDMTLKRKLRSRPKELSLVLGQKVHVLFRYAGKEVVKEWCQAEVQKVILNGLRYSVIFVDGIERIVKQSEIKPC